MGTHLGEKNSVYHLRIAYFCVTNWLSYPYGIVWRAVLHQGNECFIAATYCESGQGCTVHCYSATYYNADNTEEGISSASINHKIFCFFSTPKKNDPSYVPLQKKSYHPLYVTVPAMVQIGYLDHLQIWSHNQNKSTFRDICTSSHLKA